MSKIQPSIDYRLFLVKIDNIIPKPDSRIIVDYPGISMITQEVVHDKDLHEGVKVISNLEEVLS